MSELLDLTVVGDRHCPTTRTYLTYLKANGYLPKRLLLVDFLWGVRPRLYRYVPTDRLRHMAKNRLKAVRPVYSPEFLTLCRAIQKDVPIPIDFGAEFDFPAHAAACTTLVADDFDDPALHTAIAACGGETLLYTNGGRVSAAFLRAAPPVLHIHPGVVPFVRGSDGLFWSVLTRGRPGASCFYMAAGLDEGNLIHTREFPVPDLRGCTRNAQTAADVYAALLTAYDPHLRAMVLLDVLNTAKQAQGTSTSLKLNALPTKTQNLHEGHAYTAMHPRLVQRVISGLLEGALLP